MSNAPNTTANTSTHQNITEWRINVWAALGDDNVASFSALFPNAQRVRDASVDIWNPENHRKIGTPLLDVVASIRPHINNAQPAMQCLTWLLNTYPEVYTTQDIQWVINRNDGESQRYPARQQGYSQIHAVLNEALG